MNSPGTSATTTGQTPGQLPNQPAAGASSSTPSLNNLGTPDIMTGMPRQSGSSGLDNSGAIDTTDTTRR
jgi:hypothetical protein